MAEALTLLGLIPTLMDLGFKVVKELGELYHAEKDMRAAVSHVSAQLPLLQGLLETIKKSLQDGSRDAEQQKALANLLQNCQNQALELNSLARKIGKEALSSPPFKQVMNKLKWRSSYQRRMNDALRLLKNLETTLGLCLSMRIEALTAESISVSRRNRTLQYRNLLDPCDMVDSVKKLDGTCEWIWNQEALQRWCKTSVLEEHERFLCIYGVHGCGKSVVASTIAERLRVKQSGTEKLSVIFFPFSGTDNTRQTLEKLIRSLLWQLIQNMPDDLVEQVMDSLMLNGISVDRMFLAFASAMRLIETPVFCIVDGVDECIEDWNDSTAGCLKRMLDLLHDLPLLRVLLLGRQTALWGALRTNPLQIEVIPSLVHEDVEKLIVAELNTIKLLASSNLKDYAHKVLMAKSEGMFIWATTMLKEIRKAASASEIKTTLDYSPRGLSNAYQFVFKRLKERLEPFELERAQRLLGTIICACRPLTVKELCYAYAAQLDTGQGVENYLIADPGQGILGVCGDFITIANGMVRLSHNSLQEFLTQSVESFTTESPEIINFRVDVEASNWDLGTSCVSYLTSGDYGDPFSDPDSIQLLTAKYPLLKYASKHGVTNLQRSSFYRQDRSHLKRRFKDFLGSTGFWPCVKLFSKLVTRDLSMAAVGQEIQVFINHFNNAVGVDRYCQNQFYEVLRDEYISLEKSHDRPNHRIKELRLFASIFVDVSNLDYMAEENTLQELEGQITTGQTNVPHLYTTLSQLLDTMCSNSHILALDQSIQEIEKLLRSNMHDSDFLEGSFHMILAVIDELSLICLLSLADVYEEIEQSEQAIKLFYRASKKIGSYDIESTCFLEHNIGLCMLNLQRYDSSEEIFRREVEQRTKIQGIAHPQTVTASHELACTLYEQTRYEEATTIFRQVLDERKKSLGGYHNDTLDTEYRLALTLYEECEFEEAETIFRQVFDKEKQFLGEDNSDTMTTELWIGRTLHEQSRFDEAEIVLRRVLEGRNRCLGEDDSGTVQTEFWIALGLYRRTKFEEAEIIFRQVADKERRILGEEDIETLETEHWLGRTLCEQGRLDEAETVLRRVLNSRQQSLGKNDGDSLDTEFWLGRTLYHQAKYKQAMKTFRRVLKLQKQTLEKDHSDTLRTRSWLARTSLERSKLEKPLPSLDRLVDKKIKPPPLSLTSVSHDGDNSEGKLQLDHM